MENKRTEAKSSYHVGGMSIVFVQLVLSVLFLVLARENGMIPGKYLVPIGAGLLVFFGIAFGLQFLRGKKYIVGLVISILVDLILVGGIFSIYKADKLLVQVGGATYKTDSMVVVVRQMTRPRHWKMQKIIAMESRQVLMLRIQTRCWKM